MRWLLYIFLPFSLFAQETYENCGDLIPQIYQVDYDGDKTYHWNVSGGIITYSDVNSITVQ